MPPALVLPLGILGGVVLIVLALLWVRTRIYYVIGQTSLRVMLFGLTIRRILFVDVRRVGTRRRESNWFNTETWGNSWDGAHRGLVIHRLSGWRKKFVITPLHRYAFRNELRAAISKATGVSVEQDSAEELAEAGEAQQA